MLKTGKRIRRQRKFSEDFKLKVVKEYESGKLSIGEMAKIYDIHAQIIYRWIYKYSKYNKQSIQVVEMKDSQAYKMKQMEARIRELEQAVGQKQMNIDYLEKMIELAKENYDIDIKKLQQPTLWWFQEHKERLDYSLNSLYRMLGVSKQAVHQSLKRQQCFDMELNDLLAQIHTIREDHPGCGLEKLYKTLKPKTMGRDKFCEIFMELGYRVRKIKNYTRTTTPFWYNYPNLIEGMAVTKPYQVLQSDITYFDINGEFYYLVFIIDVYTREILGYNVGDNMRVECNIRALKMALSKIPKVYLETMIHHSDRGSQYGSKVYIKLLKDNEIKVSMGMIAQDNAFAERVNGTIKNEYLKLWHIPDLKTLEKKTRQAVNHYNEKRLHQAFKNEYSPMEFKKSLLNLKTQERPMVIIYAEGNYKVKVASSHFDFNPREEPLAHNCPMIIN